MFYDASIQKGYTNKNLGQGDSTNHRRSICLDYWSTSEGFVMAKIHSKVRDKKEEQVKETNKESK
jgi:hypothetical protein